VTSRNLEGWVVAWAFGTAATCSAGSKRAYRKLREMTGQWGARTDLWSGIASAIHGAFGIRSTLPLATTGQAPSGRKTHLRTRPVPDCSRAIEGKPMRYRWVWPVCTRAVSARDTTTRGAPWGIAPSAQVAQRGMPYAALRPLFAELRARACLIPPFPLWDRWWLIKPSLPPMQSRPSRTLKKSAT